MYYVKNVKHEKRTGKHCQAVKGPSAKEDITSKPWKFITGTAWIHSTGKHCDNKTHARVLLQKVIIFWISVPVTHFIVIVTRWCPIVP